MALPYSQIEMTRTKYEEMFDVEFQQTRSRVEPYTTVKTDCYGESVEWARMSGTDFLEYAGTRQDIVDSDITFDKRRIFKRKAHNSIPISRDEVADMQKLNYTFERVKTQQVAAAARWFDMVALGVTPIMKRDSNGKLVATRKCRLKTASDPGFCGGILGINYKGEGGLTQTSLDLSYVNGVAGKNLVPVDFTTTGTGVSSNIAGTFFDKFYYIKQMLEESEAYNDTESGQICVAISPFVKRILSEYEVSLNHDYGYGKMGENGGTTYNSHLGANFIVSNMLPQMNTTDMNNEAVNYCRMCCAWLKNRVGFGVWKNTEYELVLEPRKIDVRYRQLAVGHVGCTRLDEDTVFVMPMDEGGKPDVPDAVEGSVEEAA